MANESYFRFDDDDEDDNDDKMNYKYSHHNQMEEAWVDNTQSHVFSHKCGNTLHLRRTLERRCLTNISMLDAFKQLCIMVKKDGVVQP